MNADWHAKLYDVFCGAIALSGCPRAAYLDAACANEPSLRAQVERLLEHDPGPAMPERIGHFLIRGRLGDGGMGVVYLAQREHHPYDLVALKVIRDGADSKEFLARFEAEQKALSLLNHPNIARLYEAGVTTGGMPYFTMEYVPGVPITEFCDSSGLNTQARLSIFSQVCSAVDHAHKRGIIHRDIKPTNVLVHQIDGKPASKIIDFGVAKALNFSLSPRTLFTEHGRLVGTPEYMSPEQASTTARSVDHRTDVYSLGVLLYELLVGATPMDGKSLRAAAWHEMVRLIHEFQPPKPSVRRKTLATGKDRSAAGRGIDLHGLPRLSRDDLDQIILKAIEKKPDHRYQSAAEMAQIVDGHLRGEPIPWTVGSGWIRLRRHARRHRRFYFRTIGTCLAIASIGVWAAYDHKWRRKEVLAANATNYFGQDKWNPCVDSADELLGIDPSDSRGLYLAAACRQKRCEPLSERERTFSTDPRRALDLVNRYITNNKHDDLEYLLWNLKSVLLLELGDPLEEARHANQRAIELAPSALHPRLYQSAIRALELDFRGALEVAETGCNIQMDLAAGSEEVAPRRLDADEIWRLKGTLQLYLGSLTDARQSLQRARMLDLTDHRNRTMLARYFLRADPQDDGEALDLAAAGGQYHIHYYDRVLSFARLRSEQWEKAIEATMRNIEDDEVVSFRYAIMAIAQARLSRLTEAEENLRKAELGSEELREKGVLVTFNSGFLWIDTYAELEELLADARESLEEGRLRLIDR